MEDRCRHRRFPFLASHEAQSFQCSFRKSVPPRVASVCRSTFKLLPSTGLLPSNGADVRRRLFVNSSPRRRPHNPVVRWRTGADTAVFRSWPPMRPNRSSAHFENLSLRESLPSAVQPLSFCRQLGFCHRTPSLSRARHQIPYRRATAEGSVMRLITHDNRPNP